MSQLVELEKRMSDLRDYATVLVVNVDTPSNSRMLKFKTGISIPVLLDRGLRVSRMYDMHSRPGLPMGSMRDVPTMGYIIVDGAGIIRFQRARLYFGDDADVMIAKLKSL